MGAGAGRNVLSPTANAWLLVFSRRARRDNYWNPEFKPGGCADGLSFLWCKSGDIRNQLRENPVALFLAQSNAAGGAEKSQSFMNASLNESTVLETLRQIIDPEIGCNIVDLGLVYRVGIANGVVTVTMTLTTPGCPMH